MGHHNHQAETISESSPSMVDHSMHHSMANGDSSQGMMNHMMSMAVSCHHVTN